MSTFRRDAVRVLVPASSANLGPGFDCAGLALSIFDEYVAMVSDDEGVLVEVVGEGAGTVPLDENHLVVRCMRAAFDWLGVEQPGFVLRCTNAIPQGRGLGSSAAAIVGGIVLARAMVDDGPERMSDSDVLQLALVEENHPDNLSAALFGGFTVAWLEEDGFGDMVRMDVHPTIKIVALIPSTTVPTKAARALLPKQIPFADGAFNVSRAALLVHAMTVDPSHLMVATDDRLHQQARTEVYPDSVALVGRLRAAGVPAVISGAGPTVLALVDQQSAPALAAAADGLPWLITPVDVSATGAREVPLPPL